MFQTSKKRKAPDMVETSVVEMTKVLTEYVGQKKSEETQGLKFAYIWNNLDNLFKQMSQDDVNELNLRFISQAFEKINKNSFQSNVLFPST